MGAAPPPRVIGRYVLFGEEVGSGGMATLHIGRLVGDAGFARTIAIKRLRSTYARDPEFLAMFLDEARIAARIRHPNVAATIDVVTVEDEVLLVLEYVHGEGLGRLIRAEVAQKSLVDPRIVAGVVCGALHGLHAAHEARDERGDPLGIVHRDVSPQNVLVGDDGLARVVDFGIARAFGRLGQTRTGELKGKLAYMAPEQLSKNAAALLDRRGDVFSAGIVLWEALTGRSLFADDAGELKVLERVRKLTIPAPSTFAPALPAALDAVVARALDRDPDRRFQSALDFAVALESAVPPATPYRVGQWVLRLAGRTLAQRDAYLREIESRLPSSVEMQGRVSVASIENRLLHEAPFAAVANEPAPEIDDDVTLQDPVLDVASTPRSEGSALRRREAALFASEDGPTEPRAPRLPRTAGPPASEREWTTMRLRRTADDDDESTAHPRVRASLSRAESVVYWQSAPKRRALVVAAAAGVAGTLIVMALVLATCGA